MSPWDPNFWNSTFTSEFYTDAALIVSGCVFRPCIAENVYVELTATNDFFQHADMDRCCTEVRIYMI